MDPSSGEACSELSPDSSLRPLTVGANINKHIAGSPSDDFAGGETLSEPKEGPSARLKFHFVSSLWCSSSEAWGRYFY